MEALLLVFDKTNGKTGTADTYTDQLSNKYSVVLLGVFALVATTGNFFYQPISCFCPNEYHDSEIEYVEKVCYTQTTFYENFFEFNDEKTSISYYQWLSLILVGQAFLFYIPSSLWKVMSKKSGMTLSSITDSVKRCRRNLNSEENDVIVQFASNTINDYLRIQHKKTSEGKKKWFIFKGNYLTYLYLFVKFLYCLNAFGQLGLLNAFLGDSYHLYGFEFLQNMNRGDNWNSSSRFPKITFCEVTIYVPYHKNRKTIQCVLPMNMIYEMTFLVVWMWLVFISLLTLCSLVKWLNDLLRFSKRYDYVLNLLYKSGCLDSCSEQPEMIKDFVQDYLRKDGYFILKLVDSNTDGWMCWRLVEEIWNKYQSRQKKIRHKEKTNSEKDLGVMV